MTTTEHLIGLMGGWLTTEVDDRLNLPITEQVQEVIRFSCSTGMKPKRSIPVHARDADILISAVLVKLLNRIIDLEASHPAPLDEWGA